MNGPRLTVTAVLCAVTPFLARPATAQTGAASLTGIVTDPSGGSVAGASVKATSEATHVEYRGVSNGAGSYTIESLPLGVYVVRTTLTGFKTAVTPSLAVEANRTVRLDVTLEIGALEQTIEVSSQTPLLQTEKATVGAVISGTTLLAMPLNGRNPGQLSLLLPGAITTNPASFTTARAFVDGRPFVNGNRQQTNRYTIDGVDMSESVTNVVAYQPSPDALAEISVETSNYAADSGNVAGAVFGAVLKSGANRVSGNVFEFYRNSALDANSWANNRSGAPRPERRQHIYGATLGGPIARNKLFFFVDYQGTRFDAPGTETVSVAPDAWRHGDLSGLPAVRDPLTGLPFPGNQIPAGRISPVAGALLGNPTLYPLPNVGVTGVTGNFVGPRHQTTHADQADLRLDWNASTADKVFARFSFANYHDLVDKRALPVLLGTRTDAPFRNLALSWSRVIGSSLLNQVLVGYNRTGVVVQAVDWAGIGQANAALGIAGGQPVDGLSAIRWGNGLTDAGSAATNSDTFDQTYQVDEKLTWLSGRHALKFGGQYLHYNQRRFYAGDSGLLGFFAYGGAFSGVPFGDFLLDQVGNKGRGSESPPWTQLHDRIAVFVQDDFKVRPALTLNLGMRWAYTQPLIEEDNRQSNFDLQTGQQILATDGDRESRALYKPYRNGFEPRLGFAWRPTPRLVIRGGYGITQFMEGTGANLRLTLNAPYFYESAVQYDVTTGPGSLATGFDDVRRLDRPSGQVRAWDPDLRPQFTQQWNVFAEYLVTPVVSASVGYVGQHADHLVTPVEGNQPLPGVGDPSTWLPAQQRRPLYTTAPLLTNISTTAAGGRSDYQALQASVRARRAKGLEYLVSYTLSRARSNNPGFFTPGGVAYEGAFWMNAYQPDWNYGPAFFDATHNLVLSASWELFGGWTLSGILQAHSGFPITVVDSANRSLQGVRGNERPNCVADPVPARQSIDHWLDIDAFQRAPLGTWGNCGVAVARAPWYRNVDVAIGKRFHAGGTRALELRAEAFNLTNTPSFGPPARDINAPNTFGQITSTVSTPRTVELALKFFF